MLNTFNLVWTPLVLPLLLGSGLSLVLIFILMRRPLPKKSRIDVLMLMVGAWWATAYAMELMSAGLSAKLFWTKIQYIAIVLFPVATLVMGLIYTEQSRWLTRWNLVLLIVIPLTTLLIIFTTGGTNLFWNKITLNTQTVPQTLRVEYEAGFWLFMIYTSLFTWGGMSLMLLSFIKSPILHRRQIRILIFCFFTVMTAILLNMFDIGIASYIDLQPYAILIVCIAIGWSSYRLQIGDIVPVAYLTVIDNIPDAVVILNPNNKILKLNIAAQNLLQKSSDTLIGQSFAECSPQFNEAIQHINPDDLTITDIMVTNNSKQYAYEIKRSPVFDGRGRLASHIVIIHDITERIDEEREREQHHRYIEALWSTVPDAIVVLNVDKTVREWSEGAERIFGVLSDEAVGHALTSLTAFDTESIRNIESLLEQVWNRTTVTLEEIDLCLQKGTQITTLASGSQVLIENVFNGAVIVFTDVTGLKDVEASLRSLNEELEQRVAKRTLSLSELNSQLAEEIALHQKTETSLIQRNRELLSFQAAAAATSSSLDIIFVLETLSWEMIDLLEVDGCCVYQLKPDTNQLIVIAEYAALIAHAPTPERSINLKQGDIYLRVLQERSAIVITNSLERDNQKALSTRFEELPNAHSLVLIPMIFQGRVIGLVELAYEDPNRKFSEHQVSLAQLLANQAAIAMENANLYKRAQQEIQERERGEVRIKASLKEKEMLLQEIHHRVKNNLQVISSLLNLQSRNVTNAEILNVLRESQDRIRTMALIHEKLYQSENLASIDFGSYLKSLTSHLISTYRSSSGSARLQLDVDDVILSLETAVPCGLIVNELMSNALKYAFLDGRQGIILITLHKNEDGQTSISVADNGVGLPAGFDIHKSASLGLRLVTMLVGQIHGTLLTTNENGTKFEVVFPGD